MKKTKISLGKLTVSSFTTSHKNAVRGGDSANRVCASYYNCDTKMICETVNYTACDGGTVCKRY